MDPALVTRAEHVGVLEQLISRETALHHPQLGTTRADFDAMMDAAFREIGASGRRYSREYVLDVLDQRGRIHAEDAWETSDLDCAELAVDLYLLSYTLRQMDRLTRRTSIWRRTATGWKIVFHQGTIATDE